MALKITFFWAVALAVTMSYTLALQVIVAIVKRQDRSFTMHILAIAGFTALAATIAVFR